jgi:hypothetical protein
VTYAADIAAAIRDGAEWRRHLAKTTRNDEHLATAATYERLAGVVDHIGAQALAIEHAVTDYDRGRLDRTAELADMPPGERARILSLARHPTGRDPAADQWLPEAELADPDRLAADAIADARRTREHMAAWARGDHTHPGEDQETP